MSRTALLCVSSRPKRVVIGGRYELVRELGRGAMGEVWLAEHTTLRVPIAIKLLTQVPWAGSLEETSTTAARFRFEAQVAARLSGKTRHIVRVTDHGEDGGIPYLAMELLDGWTLETHLVREGCMPPAEVSTVVTQISRALQEAHGEGVLHRDLKPSNVFLTKDEDGGRLVKLFDFGIACMTRPRPVATGFATVAGFILGTPGYMSPEQARGAAHLDRYCDLWALATIAYEALSGDLPLEGCNTDELLKNVCAGRIVPLRQRAPSLPASLERFFGKAFAERPEGRFVTAAEFATAFAEAAAPVESAPTLISAPESALAAATSSAPSPPPSSKSIRSTRVGRGTRPLVLAAFAVAFVGVWIGGRSGTVQETRSIAALAPAAPARAIAASAHLALPMAVVPAPSFNPLPNPLPPTEPTPDSPQPTPERENAGAPPAGNVATVRVPAIAPASAPVRASQAASAPRALDRSGTL